MKTGNLNLFSAFLRLALILPRIDQAADKIDSPDIEQGEMDYPADVS